MKDTKDALLAEIDRFEERSAQRLKELEKDVKSDWDRLAEEAWRTTLACIIALVVIYCFQEAKP